MQTGMYSDGGGKLEIVLRFKKEVIMKSLKEEIEQLKRKVDPNIKECKGLYWRASVSCYLSNHNSIECRESLRLLRRKSCKGCEQCYWIWEILNEQLALDGGYQGTIEHGKIYTFNVQTSQSYYDPYPEVDYIEFIEVGDR